MRKITTRLGYVFDSTDESIEEGKKAELPIPEVVETTTIPDRVLKYLSQMYGQQQEWAQEPLKEYATTNGVESFPDYILNLNKEQLEQFLIKMYGVSAVGIRHYSSSTSDLPEIRFRTKHEKLARQLQYLWWRLGIRSRVYKNTQLGWVWESSGNEAYVRIRPYMRAGKNPKMTKKLKELDYLVPFKFRTGIQPLEDKVVSIEDHRG